MSCIVLGDEGDEESRKQLLKGHHMVRDLPAAAHKETGGSVRSLMEKGSWTKGVV
jgi:hypothetical protein